MQVRKYLLATGERGLGWDAVCRLTWQEFEELWAIFVRVTEAAHAEAKGETNHAATARETIRLEATGILDTLPAAAHQPFDFERATPEQVEAYFAQFPM